VPVLNFRPVMKSPFYSSSNCSNIYDRRPCALCLPPLAYATKTLIPDIIAVKDRQAVVIDPTIIYENSDHSLQSANKAKIQKYIPLTNEIKTLYGASLLGLSRPLQVGECSQQIDCAAQGVSTQHSVEACVMESDRGKAFRVLRTPSSTGTTYKCSYNVSTMSPPPGAGRILCGRNFTGPALLRTMVATSLGVS
jgi:hypothetical protein